MVDKPWEEGAIKVIRKAQVPVVPIYFHARNSWLFFFSPKSVAPFVLQNYHQVFSQKRRVIKVRIGKPISVGQNEYKTTELYSEFLRKKTYMLPILTIKFKLLAPHLKFKEP
jgi:1-acyl-sn-glycerol-3-phosphate acyltransferase